MWQSDSTGSIPPGNVIIAMVVLVSLVLVPTVAGETVAGISAGPAKACPDPGCTCMPEGQAASLGYTRCSVNDTPCFHDSQGRPLYCFKALSPETCGNTGCNNSGIMPSPTKSIRLVITMQAPVTRDSTCDDTGAAACTLPVPPGTTMPSATDPFSGILAFFRSLLGMR